MYVGEVEISDFHCLGPVSGEYLKVGLYYDVALFNGVVAVDEVYGEPFLYVMMFEEPGEFIEVLIESFGLF